jgi:hypothetical protein
MSMSKVPDLDGANRRYCRVFLFYGDPHGCPHHTNPFATTSLDQPIMIPVSTNLVIGFLARNGDGSDALRQFLQIEGKCR